MPYRNTDFWTYVIGTVAAVFGGIVRWKEAGMFAKPFSVLSFLLDMCISAGAGLLVFWCVVEVGQPESFAVMASAVTGNIGGRVSPSSNPLSAAVLMSERTSRTDTQQPERQS